MFYSSKEDEAKPDFFAHWGYLKYTHLYMATVPVTQGAARFAFLPGRRIPRTRQSYFELATTACVSLAEVL